MFGKFCTSQCLLIGMMHVEPQVVHELVECMCLSILAVASRRYHPQKRLGMLPISEQHAAAHLQPWLPLSVDALLAGFQPTKSARQQQRFPNLSYRTRALTLLRWPKRPLYVRLAHRGWGRLLPKSRLLPCRRELSANLPRQRTRGPLPPSHQHHLLVWIPRPRHQHCGREPWRP